MGTPCTFTVSVAEAPPAPTTVMVVEPAPCGVTVSMPFDVLVSTVATAAFAVVAVNEPLFPVCVTPNGAGEDALLTNVSGFGETAIAGTAVGVDVGVAVGTGVGVAVGIGVGVAVGAGVGVADTAPTIGETGFPALPEQPATAARNGTNAARQTNNAFLKRRLQRGTTISRSTDGPFPED